MDQDDPKPNPLVDDGGLDVPQCNRRCGYRESGKDYKSFCRYGGERVPTEGWELCYPQIRLDRQDALKWRKHGGGADVLLEQLAFLKHTQETEMKKLSDEIKVLQNELCAIEVMLS